MEGNQAIRREIWLYPPLLIVLFFAMILSPAVQTGSDSRYCLLLSETLLHKATFALDASFVLPLDPQRYVSLKADGYPYQVEKREGHVYYWYPPGSSVLSIPFVAILNPLGLKTHRPDWSYDPNNDSALQRLLASILTAAFGCLVFRTSRRVLPIGWSLTITCVVVFGAQAWSTTSRALWSDTWGILLLQLVVDRLVHLATRSRPGPSRSDSVLLATLLAWTFVVRPVNAINIVTISLFLYLFHRRNLWLYTLTGFGWALSFAAVCWFQYHRLVPGYFTLGTKLSPARFPEALAGLVISPSRGLLVFLPWLLFVFAQLILYRGTLRFVRLAGLAGISISFHILLLAFWPDWHGGFSYGPRLLSGGLPWIALLAIVATDAMCSEWDRRASTRTRRVLFLAAGIFLASLAIFIHARGALSHATYDWNMHPAPVDRNPQRLWQWTYPQFLAGWIVPPTPGPAPWLAPGTKLLMNSVQADAYLGRGWSGPETDFRWTDGHEASVVFRTDPTIPTALEIQAWPYLAGERISAQRITFILNGYHLASLTKTPASSPIDVIPIPPGALKESNRLVIQLPDAVSPAEVEPSRDKRTLALRVKWIRLR